MAEVTMFTALGVTHGGAALVGTTTRSHDARVVATARGHAATQTAPRAWGGASVMGSTPRQHRYQLPMMTRSTDVQQLSQCPGSWLLKHVHEDDQAEATYFELGSALHSTIETTILEDLDLDQALALVTGRLEDWVSRIDRELSPDVEVLETSKRGVSTIFDDADRMMRSWFKWVHPDSDKRHPIYEDYIWPPVVEVPFQRTHWELKYPVWGSVDAIFNHRQPEIVGNHPLIVDWKSGTSKQRDSNQLDHYRFGIEMPSAVAVFHHLDRKQKRSVIQEADPYPGDRVVIRRIQQAEREKEQIVNGGPVQFNPDWWCNFCVVREHCPKEGSDSRGNRATLRRTLKLVRPMESIERVA